MPRLGKDVEYLEPEFGDHMSENEKAVKEKAKVIEDIVETKKAKKTVFEIGKISTYSPSELCSLFEKHLNKAFPSLSSIEREELILSREAFGRGSSFEGENFKFEQFFTNTVEHWDCLDAKKPTVIVLASSAIRCVELLKRLSNVRNKVTIAKLFAKHFKLQEQKTFLSSHPSPIAIGTPGRILKLVEDDDKPIDADLITHIIIDTLRDAKDRTVFDVPEIRNEMMKLFCKTSLRYRLNQGLTKMYFF